jgi:hypothetical protein
MKPAPRKAIALCLVLATAACASALPPVATEGKAQVEGTITSIDLQPWTYDGNAVITLDAGARGPMAVELPARWNLCKAAPVDTEALAVGMRVRATGTLRDADRLVVCQDESHRLVPADAAEAAPRD